MEEKESTNITGQKRDSREIEQEPSEGKPLTRTVSLSGELGID